MNINLKSFFPLPLTYTLLMITAVVYITIFTATSPYTYLLPIIYALCIIIAAYKKNIPFLIITLCLTFASLFAFIRLQQQIIQHYSNQEFLNCPTTIEGVVLQINKSDLLKEQTTILLQTNKIYKKNKATLQKSLNISIFIPTKNISHLQVNDVVKIYNTQLNQPSQNDDYQKYLIKENIWATAHCANNSISIIESSKTCFARKVATSLYNHLNNATKPLFEALFLGKKEKGSLTLKTQHNCIYWGIAHHMARSGAHLAILFGLFMFLLQCCYFSHVYRYVIILFALFTYTHISYLSISFTRALIMITLYLLCKIFNHPSSSLHVITLTALTIALFNPAQVFFLDFQLSFGITYIIIWLFNIKKSKTIAFANRHTIHS